MGEELKKVLGRRLVPEVEIVGKPSYLGNQTSTWKGRYSHEEPKIMVAPLPKISEETQLMHMREGQEFASNFLSSLAKKPDVNPTA